MPTITKGKGGAERVCAELCNEMIARGHQVGVLAFAEQGEESSYQLHPSVELICCSFRYQEDPILIQKKIKAYDPKAMHEAQEFYLKGVENVTYFDSKYETLPESDAMLLLTDWKEFRIPDFEELKSKLNQPIIFDGRNQYDDKMMKEKGFEYFQIGKQPL